MNDLFSIIVIGQNRSGTKWLSNILCNHPDIFGFMGHYGGIHEAGFEPFYYLFPDLSRIDDFIAFNELFVQTDLFKQSGLNKDYFYHLDPKPTTYYQMFEKMVTECSRANHKKGWVQKASPHAFKELIKAYPKANFIIIQRKFIDTLKSQKANYLAFGKKVSLFKLIIQFVYQRKLIKINKKHLGKCLSINYKDLKGSQEGSLKKVLKFLNLEYHSHILIEQKENTYHSSFKNKEERKNIFGLKDKILSFFYLIVLYAIPLILMETIWVMVSKEKGRMVGGMFSLIAKKYGFDYYKKSLKTKG